MSDADLIVDNVIEKKQFFPTIIAIEVHDSIFANND